MVNREEYAKAKRLLKDIHHELATQPLTQAQREELQDQAAGLAGILSSPWLPVSWIRRVIMLAIVLLGLQQALIGHYGAMLWWLLLPLFSPRIVGEAAHLCGIGTRAVNDDDEAQA